MKTPSNNLFQLIQSMTAAEKRYFKRHYALGKTLAIELFDFINGMDHYDEEQIKRRFVDSKLAKNLKVYKVQLTNLVMKSLVSYHDKRNVKSKIRIGLEEIDILMDKGLSELAFSRLRKLKTLCEQHEELSYLEEIVEREAQLT